MGSIWKENWKRGAKKSSVSAFDNHDLLRVEDQSSLTTNASGIGGFPVVGAPSSGNIIQFINNQWIPVLFTAGAQTALVTDTIPGLTTGNRDNPVGFTFVRALIFGSIPGLASNDEPAIAFMMASWDGDGQTNSNFFVELQTDTGPIHTSIANLNASFHLQRLASVLIFEPERVSNSTLRWNISTNTFSGNTIVGAILFSA